MTDDSPAARLAQARAVRSRGAADMNQLANRVWLMRTLPPGIAFARKAESGIKQDMRLQVVEAFAARPAEKLTVLTFPGVFFSFERALLARREQQDSRRAACLLEPRKTHLTCLEREEELFRAALRFLPGLSAGELRIRPSPSWATATAQTRCVIGGFHRATFEDLAYAGNGAHGRAYNAAWLDFNGPLNRTRARAVRRFWLTQLSWRLALTVLGARYDAYVRQRLARYGSYEDWLSEYLPGATVLSTTHYTDPSPMVQIILQKEV